MRSEPPPRLLPDAPLPHHAHVPGRNSRPASEAIEAIHGAPADPDRWQDCRAYLYGLDLFNHGYYWEAHEAWEGLWHACGRRGPTADFLRGLIKLAAAGVKVRQGVPAGVASHARRGAAIFQDLARRLGGDGCYMGLRLSDLLAHARAIEALAPSVMGDRDAGVRVVFDFVLVPQSIAGP